MRLPTPLVLVACLVSIPTRAHAAPAPDPAQVCSIKPGSPPPRPRPKMRTHSPAMVNAGASIMGVFGALGVALSIAAAATDRPPSSCSGSFCLPSSSDWNFEPLFLGGGAALAFGHALGIGIPLIAAGAQEKPAGPDEPKPREPAAVALAIGPGTVSGMW